MNRAYIRKLLSNAMNLTRANPDIKNRKSRARELLKTHADIVNQYDRALMFKSKTHYPDIEAGTMQMTIGIYYLNPNNPDESPQLAEEITFEDFYELITDSIQLQEALNERLPLSAVGRSITRALDYRQDEIVNDPYINHKQGHISAIEQTKWNLVSKVTDTMPSAELYGKPDWVCKVVEESPYWARELTGELEH